MNITCSCCKLDVSVCQCPPADWATPPACPFTTVEGEDGTLANVVAFTGGLALVNPPLQIDGMLPKTEAEWAAFQSRRAL